MIKLLIYYEAYEAMYDASDRTGKVQKVQSEKEIKILGKKVIHC